MAPGVGNRNINLDFTSGAEGKGKSKNKSGGGKTQLSWSIWDVLPTGPGENWSYWLVDMWLDGQWKLEGQALVDWVVEQVVVIEEV